MADSLSSLLQSFVDLSPEIRKYGEEIKDALANELKKRSIAHQLTSRLKDVQSLAYKIQKKNKKSLDDLSDLYGIRLILPTTEDLDAVCAIVQALFPDDWDPTQSYDRLYRAENRPSVFDYTMDAVHHVFGRTIDGAKVHVELQIRTELLHTWANLSHESMYKAEHEETEFKATLGAPVLPVEENRGFGRLKGTLELIDRDYERLQNDLFRMDLYFGPYLSKAHVAQKASVLNATIAALSSDKVKYKDALRQALLERVRLGLRTNEYDAALSAWTEFEALGESTLENRFLGLQLRDRLGNGDVAKDLADWISEFEESRTTLDNGTVLFDFQKVATAPDRRLLASAYLLLSKYPSSARKALQEARDLSPQDPFILAAIIERTLKDGGQVDALVLDQGPGIQQAIERCEALFEAGLELPGALFALARFQLLTCRDLETPLDAYCHALALAVSPEAAVDARYFIDREIEFLQVLSKSANGNASTILSLFDLVHKSTELGPEHSGLAIVVAGTTGTQKTDHLDAWTRLLEDAITGFDGPILCGGTEAGVCKATMDAAAKGGKKQSVFGFTLRAHTRSIRCRFLWQPRQDPVIPVEGILAYWTALVTGKMGSGPVSPRNTTLFGFGGGDISKLEYRIAAALGARVAILQQADREGAALLQERKWKVVRHIFPIAADPSAYWFAAQRPEPLKENRSRIAIAIHNLFTRQGDAIKIDPEVSKSIESIDELAITYAKANLAQADALPLLLAQAGMLLVPEGTDGESVIEFANEELEHLSELEHGRWIIDRCLDGWRFGITRDNLKKHHPDLVPWTQWPEFQLVEANGTTMSESDTTYQHLNFDTTSKIKDSNTVRGWPKILADVGLAIIRTKA